MHHRGITSALAIAFVVYAVILVTWNGSDRRVVLPMQTLLVGRKQKSSTSTSKLRYQNGTSPAPQPLQDLTSLQVKNTSDTAGVHATVTGSKQSPSFPGAHPAPSPRAWISHADAASSSPQTSSANTKASPAPQPSTRPSAPQPSMSSVSEASPTPSSETDSQTLPSQLRYDGNAASHILRVWRNTDLSMQKFEPGTWPSALREKCPAGPKLWVFWTGHFRTASFITNTNRSGWPRYHVVSHPNNPYTIPGNSLSYKQMLDRSAGGPCWFVVGFFPAEITSTSFDIRNPPWMNVQALLRYGYLNQTNGGLPNVPKGDVDLWKRVSTTMRGKQKGGSFASSSKFRAAYERLMKYNFPGGQSPSLFQRMLSETAQNLDGKFAYIVARRGGNADSHKSGKKPWQAYLRHMHAVWVAARQAAAFNGMPIDPLSLVVRSRPDIMLPEFGDVDDMLHGFGTQCAFGDLVKTARTTPSTNWSAKLYAIQELGFLVAGGEGRKAVSPFQLGGESNSLLMCPSAHIVVSQRKDADNNAFFSFLSYEYDVAIPLELSALSDVQLGNKKTGVRLQETLKDFAEKIWWAKGYHLNWGSDRDVANSCFCSYALAHLSSWKSADHDQNRVKSEMKKQLSKWQTSQRNGVQLQCRGFLSCKTRNLDGWQNHKLVRLWYMHIRWKKGSKYNDPVPAPIPAVSIASGLHDLSTRSRNAGAPSDKNQWYYSTDRDKGWIRRNPMGINEVVASSTYGS